MSTKALKGLAKFEAVVEFRAQLVRNRDRAVSMGDEAAEMLWLATIIDFDRISLMDEPK